MASVAGIAVLVAAGCTPEAPLPRPLPANIAITTTPPYAATVDTSVADSVVIDFDRPMEPQSLLFIRRVSFLLPLTVEPVEGRWNDSYTRLAFQMARFPVQPGATYEAVFAGLRTADGELYNRGPFQVLFRTRGVPDVFPMAPHPRIAQRTFCRSGDPGSQHCDLEIVVEATGVAPNQVTLDSRCLDCPTVERRDWYQRSAQRIHWLGFDELDASGAATRTVRWPAPVVVFQSPLQRRDRFTSPPQTSPDGTTLTGWTSFYTGNESISRSMSASVLPIQVVFSESRLVAFEYTIEPPGAMPQHRSERWWLYPGVGIVKREARITEGSEPLRLEIDTYTPPFSILSN